MNAKNVLRSHSSFPLKYSQEVKTSASRVAATGVRVPQAGGVEAAMEICLNAPADAFAKGLQH